MKNLKRFLTLFAIISLVLVGCNNSDNAKAKDETFDVVVIGAGGAGLSAAIQAQENGAHVVVLEKMGMVGGNTVRATGGMNAAGTVFQEKIGIKDSPEVMYEDTMKGGKNVNDPALVHVLAEESASAIDWLTELGADVSDVGAAGGATNNRIHRPTGGAKIGDNIVSTLKKQTEDRNISVRTENEITKILVDDSGAVTGVTVKSKDGEYTINTKAVIVAGGGFGANAEMQVELKPELKGFTTTNHKGALGEGIKLAQEVGADTVDMKEIQTHPTVEIESSEMITEGVRGNGAILVNQKGERFINELLTRDVVSEAILNQDGEYAYLLFNQEVRDSLKAIEAYVKQGLVTEGATVEDLAKALDVDGAELQKTIEGYAASIAGSEDIVGRTNFPANLTFNEGTWYAIKVAPAVHHTMGGLKINTDAEVISTKGDVIDGLYAAGEVTGGVHGANRLGGNAVADIVVFGRIAGRNAAEFVKGDASK